MGGQFEGAARRAEPNGLGGRVEAECEEGRLEFWDSEVERSDHAFAGPGGDRYRERRKVGARHLAFHLYYIL